MKTALITGASGQDAYYLALLLLEKGYRVVATQRRSARAYSSTVEELCKNDNYILEWGDVTDMSAILRVVKQYQPDEFYHLAAQSEVGTSFHEPLSTISITGKGAAICLEAVRIGAPECKFYFAGSSEQYGDAHGGLPTNEESPMLPRSPYACAKLMGYNLTRVYRESYGMFACAGVLFNHESPERKPYFVTRKITHGVARIVAGIDKHIELGNLDSGRDWGHSADYMRAAWMMLQADKPDDYVVAMGTFNTIEDLLRIAFAEAGLSSWENPDGWKPYIKQNPKWMRPHDVTRLIGDSSKIRKSLGWQPDYTFEKMIREMVQHDLRLLKCASNSN